MTQRDRENALTDPPPVFRYRRKLYTPGLHRDRGPSDSESEGPLTSVSARTRRMHYTPPTVYKAVCCTIYFLRLALRRDSI